MRRRPNTPSREEQPTPPSPWQATRRRGSYARAHRSDEDDARSSRSRASSGHGSVDRVLLEHFSSSDSISNPSVQNPQSSDSDFRGESRGGIINYMTRNLNHTLVKRRARKLLAQLVKAEKQISGSVAQRLMRHDAAIGLVKIVENERGGEEIVARRFVKKASRQGKGTRALLKLSDDELDQLEFRAVSPVPKPLPFTTLLGVVLKHTNESQFYRTTISTALRDGGTGAAGILYLATRETSNFCSNIEDKLIISFCERVLTHTVSLSSRWYCGAKLFCLFLEHDVTLRSRAGIPTLNLLSFLFELLIQNATIAPNPEPPRSSGKDPTDPGPVLLPLIAMCCDYIGSKECWSSLPHSSNLSIFVKRLITLVHSEDTGPRCLNTERGFALSILLFLLKRTSAIKFTPIAEISQLGSILINMALYQWVLDVQEADVFAMEVLKPLKYGVDRWCIDGLCRLPESAFNEALSSALNKGIIQLESPETKNLYEPLGLVERLLWLSNIRPPDEDADQIHRALVNGDACMFLGNVLSHNGDPDTHDRGVWRAKGLAMTCIGNIVERMDEREFRNRITKDMVGSVVAIKEHGDVPLVQKGQAIFTLQRYTLAADRWCIQPFYREDSSNIAEEFRTTNTGNVRPP